MLKCLAYVSEVTPNLTSSPCEVDLNHQRAREKRHVAAWLNGKTWIHTFDLGIWVFDFLTASPGSNGL